MYSKNQETVIKLDYKEIIYLVKTHKKRDNVGNLIDENAKQIKCYAKKQSVKLNEFYNAVQVGLKPTCEFVIKRLNYDEENELIWNNQRYQIIRTVDPKNKHDIVLVCSKKIGVND